MNEAKRLHPIAIVIYITKRLKQGPFLALALLWAIKRTTGDPFVDWLPLFFFLFYAMLAGYMSWRRFTYRLQDLFVVYCWPFFSLHELYSCETSKHVNDYNRIAAKKSISTSTERVQGIGGKESPVRRLFGYVSVHLIHAGGSLDDGKQGSLLLFPLVRKTDVPSLVASCLPSYHVHDLLQPLPKHARFRYILRPLYIVMPIVLATTVWLERFETLLLVFLAIYVGHRSYKQAGVAIKGEQLALRRGWLTTKTVYMLKHRIQSLTISQSRMQQRLGLCTVHATVMPGIRAKVVDVDESTAKTIYEWFLGN